MKKLVCLVVACAALVGCATVPYAVGKRRQISGVLKYCLQPNARREIGYSSEFRTPAQRQACLDRSNVQCNAAGLEQNCGVDGL